MNIEYNGKTYNFIKQSGLTNTQFYEKCWYIAKSEPKNQKEYDLYDKMSNIHINKLFLNCKYSNNIETNLSKLSN